MCRGTTAASSQGALSHPAYVAECQRTNADVMCKLQIFGLTLESLSGHTLLLRLLLLLLLLICVLCFQMCTAEPKVPAKLASFHSISGKMPLQLQSGMSSASRGHKRILKPRNAPKDGGIIYEAYVKAFVPHKLLKFTRIVIDFCSVEND